VSPSTTFEGCDTAWSHDLANVVDGVYATNGHLIDHRRRFPWLQGFLGNPDARVWFVAWYPSTRAVERIHSSSATCESQWLATEGDRIFRRNLVRVGFKTGTIDSPGGWKCYITDLVKADAPPSEWDSTSAATRKKAYETWLPVLDWEFRHGQPRLVVAVGKDVNRRLDDIWPFLQKASRRPLDRAVIWHYAFFNRGGDSAVNRTKYAKQFDDVVRKARQLK
jgi:hypothetical protein